MAETTEAALLLAEPMGFMWFLALILLGLLARLGPRPAQARATISLAVPRLVPLGPQETVTAAHLLGAIAADALAGVEDPE